MGAGRTTEENTSLTLETDRRNLLYIPSSSYPPFSHINELPPLSQLAAVAAWLSSAWLWYMQTLLTRCRCQVWAGIILPRWVIKHIWSISAFPTRPQQPALGYVLRLDCRGSPATCTFLKINLSHIGGQETARLCATSTRARWLEHYQGGRVRNGTIWITCDICHCFIVTRRRSLKQWCAVRCYLPDFSFTPELPERVNRVSFVWHVTAN